MPLPFLRSSSASIASGTSTSAVPPPRPPSPLSAANATSRSSRSSRPSTAASTSSGIRDRRPSTRHGQSALSQLASSKPEDAPPVPAAPPLSQSSRSLSSRLLRRRPSEKASLSRTPRLPLVSVASDTDGPSEPLTGSTTISDVFAGQQDAGLGGPIAARGAEVGRRRSESESGELGMTDDPEAEKWRARLNNENTWAGKGDRSGSDWSTATGSTTLNSPKLKGVFTALPPPPRQGNRGIIRRETLTVLPLEEEVEVPHLGLQKDLWGRRSSDPAKISALLESFMPTQLPLDHPFEQRPPASFQFQRKSSTSTTNSSSGHSRANGLGSSVPKESSRFGDAPPLPVANTGATHFSPPRNGRDDSPRSRRQVDRGGIRRTTPPPRSSSRLNNAIDSFDTSSSPQASSSFSGKKKLLASPTFLATAPRKSSLTSNTLSPEHLWAYSQPLPSLKHISRSSSFSTSSALHAVPVPPVPPEVLYSPPPPLRYRSPRTGSGSRNSFASPTRPPRWGRRGTGLASMSASEETGAESDEEDEMKGSASGGMQFRTGEGKGEVTAVCVDLGAGVYKWEIVVRSGRSQGKEEGRVTSIELSTNPRTVSVPGSARHLNLSLSLDDPTGQLTFESPPLLNNATPKTNPTSRWQYTPASQTRPAIPHTRGDTFGATGTRKSGMGLTVEEVDGSPSPSPSTSTSISLGSTDLKSNLDRADTITPPPRMQTPPPMPSHPKINSTPKGFRSHRRTSSSGSRNWPEPAPSTPTSGRHSRDSSATYISSPSPRSTPRRTRLLSAKQLNGGLYAPGTMDGLSEELEGISVGAR